MDEFAVLAGAMPEGAIPMYGFVIAVYMNPEDNIVYDDYITIGDATLRDLLGTLDSVKFRAACSQFDVVREED